MVNEDCFLSLIHTVWINFDVEMATLLNLHYEIFGGLRLFKRLCLLIFVKLYKATFIWEATFIRDLRVLFCFWKKTEIKLQYFEKFLRQKTISFLWRTKSFWKERRITLNYKHNWILFNFIRKIPFRFCKDRHSAKSSSLWWCHS